LQITLPRKNIIVEKAASKKNTPIVPPIASGSFNFRYKKPTTGRKSQAKK
jgi:hypothetical protein